MKILYSIDWLCNSEMSGKQSIEHSGIYQSQTQNSVKPRNQINPEISLQCKIVQTDVQSMINNMNWY